MYVSPLMNHFRGADNKRWRRIEHLTEPTGHYII